MRTLAEESLMVPSLLQTAGSGSSMSAQVLIWVGVLIVVAMVGGAVVMVLRRRMFDQDAGGSAGSLLEDLRRMRREGEISDGEFEQAKRALTEKIAKSLDAKREQADALRPRTGEKSAKTTRKPPTTHPGPGRDAPPGYDLAGDPLPRPHDPE